MCRPAVEMAAAMMPATEMVTASAATMATTVAASMTTAAATTAAVAAATVPATASRDRKIRHRQHHRKGNGCNSQGDP